VLSDVIGDLLPSAVAVALSPIPVIAVVLVLGSRHARTAGPAFALGWITGLAAVSALVLLLLSGGADDDGDDPGVAWLQLAVGLLFLVLAVKQWRKRPGTGETPEMPGWMATVDSATPPKAAVLGLALSGANPKNVALTLATAASIAEAGLDPADEAIAISVFVAVGSATVGGAVLANLLLGDRAARGLAAVRRFMADNNAVIMTVVLLLLGAKFVGDALGGA
jgi:threonine/homoserine/homoserine lactone efflux protein